jgi:hypothetical protein
MSAGETLSGVVTWLLFTTVSAALYYLGSRARVTRFLWSRYPNGFDDFMLCAACTGTWFGFALGTTLGWWQHLPYLGLPGGHPVTIIVAGLCSMVWTPIMADKMAGSLERMAARNYGPAPQAPAVQPPAPGVVDSSTPGVEVVVDEQKGGRGGTQV